jgi:hypothetical protein
MNKQALKCLEEQWNAYFAIELGIDKTEFLKRSAEIKKMVDDQVPLQQILNKIHELQGMLKTKSISSNSTSMISE